MARQFKKWVGKEIRLVKWTGNKSEVITGRVQCIYRPNISKAEREYFIQELSGKRHPVYVRGKDRITVDTHTETVHYDPEFRRTA